MGLALRARPEALADVPGTGDLPLTRAIIQYRASHEIEPRGGRIEDIGLALVLDGEYAASAEVLELGSAEVRHLDLSAELVIVDWVYEPTLDHVRTLLRSPRDVSLLSGEVVPGPLRQYCQAITLSVLRRAGFTALTRPTFLRIGFRDVVRDLDLNERTAARIVLRAGDVATFHFRYDDAVLCIERSRTEPDAEFERLLLEAFPAADSHRVPYPDRLGYDLRFPLPLSLRPGPHPDGPDPRGTPAALRPLRAGALPGRAARAGRLRPRRHARAARALGTAHARRPAPRPPQGGGLSRRAGPVFSHFFRARRGPSRHGTPAGTAWGCASSAAWPPFRSRGPGAAENARIGSGSIV